LEETKRVTKRFEISEETYKEIKITAIKLGLDDDGKMTPAILGKAIDFLVSRKKDEDKTNS
jgi:hypothetical protein